MASRILSKRIHSTVCSFLCLVLILGGIFVYQIDFVDHSAENSQDSLASDSNDFTPPVGAEEGAGNYGPWNTRLLLASSEDGIHFTRKNEVVSDQADVPDLAIDEKGSIYLYYTNWTLSVGSEIQRNKTVVAISSDGGNSWIYKLLEFKGFENMSSPVDPDIQILEDGTFRLYLTADPHDGYGPHTYYAESLDGIHFENKGIAFQNEDPMVLDPSTLQVDDFWIYFAAGGPGGQWFATSEDGTHFEEAEGAPDTRIDGETYMMANGIAVEGAYRFYAFSNRNADIRSFFSTDGLHWTPEEDFHWEVDESTGLESDFVKDPSVIQLEDGSYLMVYVSLIPGSFSGDSQNPPKSNDPSRRDEPAPEPPT